MNIYDTYEQTEEKRNWKIFFEWIRGKNWSALSDQFNLSRDKIKRICLAKVPYKVRNSDKLSANEFSAYRLWKRQHSKTSKRQKEGI